MNSINLSDVDIVYLSFDEPNAEKNYADLLTKVPWAKRVHGVEGSDASHKACADIAETYNFVTVDGDNIINPKFLNLTLDFDKLGADKTYVFSWCGKIHVNGLMYGNGGLKLWNKDFVYNMKTHEAADNDDVENNVEFCFDKKYFQLNDNYSVSYTNASPWQAWRAGFREGVKMTLDRGYKVDNIKNVWWQNYQRLLIWCNVGMHVDNGIFSILGARAGLHKTMIENWDHTQVRDFRFLNDLWEAEFDINENDAMQMAINYGNSLSKELDLEIDSMPLSKLQSEFFSKVYINTKRVLND